MNFKNFFFFKVANHEWIVVIYIVPIKSLQTSQYNTILNIYNIKKQNKNKNKKKQNKTILLQSTEYYVEGGTRSGGKHSTSVVHIQIFNQFLRWPILNTHNALWKHFKLWKLILMGNQNFTRL
jgi:hypothetical protein